MAGCPDVAVDSGGATPDVPLSAVMAGSPRHSGWLGDGELVAGDEREGVRAPVADSVAKALGEPVPVPLGDAVLVRLGVLLGVPLPDALADGLRRLATLTPRYVSRATTSSGDSPPPAPPPLPPAASHSSADSRMPLAMVLDGTSSVTLAYRKHSDAGVASQRRAGSCSTYE
jgi:hypothetical protein